MKFSDLLGDPEPDPRSEPTRDAEPISVFAPEPEVTPSVGAPAGAAPAPTGPKPPATPVSRWADNVVVPATGRSGLAELNVRQPGSSSPAEADASVVDQLGGLTEIVDDLLPSARRGRK